MSNCLITFKSATYSMKAQLILSRNAIPSKPVKLDSEYSGKGCTQGIRVDYRYCKMAERLLHDNGVPYSAIINS